MCAHQCLKYQTSSSLCNTYSFDNVSMTCSLASLPFLEDPSPGETPLTIMTDISSLENLEMRSVGIIIVDMKYPTTDAAVASIAASRTVSGCAGREKETATVIWTVTLDWSVETTTATTR